MITLRNQISIIGKGIAYDNTQESDFYYRQVVLIKTKGCEIVHSKTIFLQVSFDDQHRLVVYANKTPVQHAWLYRQ